MGPSRERSPNLFVALDESRACAIPLSCVVETMRPLPIEAIAGTLSYVRGLAMIRGASVPVVDLAALLGFGQTTPTRFVTVRTEAATVALAVASVRGVTLLDRDRMEALPPLASSASAAIIEAIVAVDSRLLIVLRAARLLPDGWEAAS